MGKINLIVNLQNLLCSKTMDEWHLVCSQHVLGVWNIKMKTRQPLTSRCCEVVRDTNTYTNQSVIRQNVRSAGIELHACCNWRIDEGTKKDGSQGIRNYILILNHGFTLESFRRGFKSTDTCDLIPEILILRFWNGPLVQVLFFFFPFLFNFFWLCHMSHGILVP